MSEELDDILPPSDVVAWEEIEATAKLMFQFWMGGGELMWVRECWQHFEKKGLTRNMGPLEETTTHLRLLTLVRIYEQFSGLEWDDNPQTSLFHLTESLSIDPLSLGLLAGAASPAGFDEDLDEFELKESALIAATDALRQQIHTCLVEAYGGDIALYCRLVTTHLTPDADPHEFRITNFNYLALEFVTEGFPA